MGPALLGDFECRSRRWSSNGLQEKENISIISQKLDFFSCENDKVDGKSDKLPNLERHSHRTKHYQFMKVKWVERITKSNH